MNGWIKLHRQLLDWEWYQDPNTLRLFIHLLIKANHVENKWKGILIQEGQLLTDRKSLSNELGITEQSIRTSIKRLKSTSEITIKTTNKYTLISINNWKDFQQSTSKLTNNQPTTNQLTSSLKNDKKNKKNTQAEEFINWLNLKYKSKYSSKPIEKNLTYWLKIYSMEQIQEAYSLGKKDKWWSDKITPTKLLRTRDVDHIGDLLNRVVKQTEEEKLLSGIKIFKRGQ